MRILPLVLGGLAAIGVVGGWTFRDLFAAPTPVEPFNWETLREDTRVFLAERVELTRQNVGSAKAHGSLGLAYEANRLWAEARECYEIAADLDPSEPLWRFHRAIADHALGDSTTALEAYAALESEMPESIALLHRLGERFLENNELGKALERFERVIELAPQLPEGFVGRGSVYNRQAKYTEAVEDLELAVKLDGLYRTAHYQLGLAYRSLDETRKARSSLKKGQGSWPRYLPDALATEKRGYKVNYSMQIAFAHTAAQEGDTEKAIRILESYRKLRPNDVNVQNRLARAYRQGGKLGKALVALKRSVAIDGEQFETLLELAATLLEAGATKRALSEAERAIELVPEESAAHLMKAHILMQMQRLREAALALQRAEKVAPGEERVAQLTLELERLKKKRP